MSEAHSESETTANGGHADPSLNPSSLYCIHPSEGPSSVTITPVLTGSNYPSWSRTIRMTPISKNQMGFLNGVIAQPVAIDPLRIPWERCNTLIMSWLLNSLSPSIAQSFIYFESVVAIWDDLRDRFYQSDLLRIAELQEEIYGIKQGSRSVSEYYTSLKTLWEELDNYRPFPECQCYAKTYHQQDFIIRFLKGLEDQFSVVRSQILLMDPLPPISHVFSMVVQQERQHLLSHGEEEPNAVINSGFTSSGKGRNSQVPPRGPTSNNTRNASNKKCVYCHRTGHTIETCYGKHGYPPGHPRYPSCPRFNQRDDTSSAHNAVQETNNNDHNPSIEGSSSNGSRFHLTQAQYQTLINLLQPQPSDTDGTSPVQPSRANITQVSSPTGPIHEMGSLKTIGLGKLNQGIYHLDINQHASLTSPKASFISNFTTPPINNANLWHFRLGHLSEKRFQTGTKGYVVFDINNKEIFVSRNVTFNETFFPFSVPCPASPSTNTARLDHATNPIHIKTLPELEIDYYNHPPFESPTHHESIDSPDPTLCPNLPSPSQISDHPSPHHQPSPSSPLPNSPPPPRHSTWVTTHASYLDDYYCNISSSDLAIVPKDSNQSPSKISYPLQSVVTYSHLSSSYSHVLMSLNREEEPKTYQEAVTQHCWQEAMQAEILALRQNKTWDIVPTPPSIKPIRCKWVFKIKRRPDGYVERYKARLVVKGYSQIEGVDYLKTFSPVVKMATVRVLLALASIHNWDLHQLDVSNAFLHGNLSEDVYMVIPPGLSGHPTDHCCKLKKSLYGLKQASRKWYEKLSLLLLSSRYIQAHADHSLFVKVTGSAFTALIVYVDDIVLTGNSSSEITKIKTILHSHFHIKDLGQLKYFLGIEVAHSSKDLIKESGLMGCKPSSTPMNDSLRLYQDSSGPLADPLSYRRLVGHLIYLTSTRPDIVFATQQLSQFMVAPTQTHFQAALRVVCYLKGCPGKGLFFSRKSSTQLHGFSDAGLMHLLPVSSSHQLADIFTKALPPWLFHSNLSKLELLDIIKPPSCEGLKEEERFHNSSSINKPNPIE
ncbi:hypothetical protein V8G54_004779 [Vigna mungo]|uniref:Retrovirus-related Pol polyprotein from transposon TNT 1-94 n=1 Tax=Vigna mungo TaxID=3915 RepID=A0AAQ3PCX3_VIGMU